MNNTAQSAVDPLHQKLNVLMRVMDVDQWKFLVSRINDPTTAEIIVEYLDNDATEKARYAGIYLRARDTVRRSNVRYAKALKWGQRFGRLMGWIFRFGKQAPTVGQSSARFCVREERESEPLVWPVLDPQ